MTTAHQESSSTPTARRVLSITSIELRTPVYYFPLTYSAMKIVRQLNAPGCLGWKSRGFWKSHYTMTLWENEESMRRFVREGAHKLAMGKSKKLSTEIRLLTIECDDMLPWAEAKVRLKNDGRVLRF